MLYGKDIMNQPSRFIKEIDKNLLDIEKEESFFDEPEKIDKEEIYNKNIDIEFKPGDVIMHLIYGKGVIVEVNGDFITVAFDKRFGIKKLLKNHKSINKL